ncbi:Sec-independent protein secretion pathway component TatC [Parabacteroides sp. PF5-5]|uniref:hypothetical protein n=1 Tax=unclassified Parabacteroides TaxID=2649774 RepID=UPI0024746280|nr:MULTISPECIES: hypothetical protein [unclassified Parabacteroides]MDH6304324.1 Sec-independent protein secretion pathway component TatC [Parabacteroides sp. PH5-39]MDH6315523.1 Sec-independent protein secretion pathway component TatC [Parabacteroides sp. PF5-13]MDH6318983.1 Sec-independent protein secretion pathway component TatC [Parabacteroides sp. PH5-13]MDH6322712.1 Sec-independent protein secretion pathway component TatC [Parabacteroides sp. PH5-8]MDH6326716.1 Sec-independent protein se
MSKKKKIIMSVIIALIIIAVAGSIAGYYILQPDKPWMALYLAGSGGIIAFNLLVILFFVNKNMRN